MKKHFLSLLPVVLCAPLLAQGGTVPPGFDTTESSGLKDYSFRLGYYANMRAQILNADLTGKGVKIMAEISFRQDGSRTSSRGVARTWTLITLMMGETRVSAPNSTWTRNHLTTPTTVFSAKHSWPSITTQPPGAPNPWDNQGLKFPFTGKFVYGGKKDLLLDMEMRGGSLANSGAWGTNASGSSPTKTYFLDGRSNSTSDQGSLGVYGLRLPCTFDSGNVTNSTLGGGYGYLVAYTQNSPSSRFQYRTYYTNMPKSTPFVQALSLGGTTSTTTPGPIPGLGCQALQIDVSKIFLTQMFMTPASGTYSQANQYTPFVAGAVGIWIWSQGIWADTVTNNAKLTRTGRLIMAALPRRPDFNGRLLYRYAPPTGAVPNASSSTLYIPLYRYK